MCSKCIRLISEIWRPMQSKRNFFEYSEVNMFKKMIACSLSVCWQLSFSLFFFRTMRARRKRLPNSCCPNGIFTCCPSSLCDPLGLEVCWYMVFCCRNCSQQVPFLIGCRPDRVGPRMHRKLVESRCLSWLRYEPPCWNCWGGTHSLKSRIRSLKILLKMNWMMSRPPQPP